MDGNTMAPPFKSPSCLTAEAKPTPKMIKAQMQKMKIFFQALKALEKILPDSTKRIFRIILTYK